MFYSSATHIKSINLIKSIVVCHSSCSRCVMVYLLWWRSDVLCVFKDRSCDFKHYLVVFKSARFLKLYSSHHRWSGAVWINLFWVDYNPSGKGPTKSLQQCSLNSIKSEYDSCFPALRWKADVTITFHCFISSSRLFYPSSSSSSLLSQLFHQPELLWILVQIFFFIFIFATVFIVFFTKGTGLKLELGQPLSSTELGCSGSHVSVLQQEGVMMAWWSQTLTPPHLKLPEAERCICAARRCSCSHPCLCHPLQSRADCRPSALPVTASFILLTPYLVDGSTRLNITRPICHTEQSHEL